MWKASLSASVAGEFGSGQGLRGILPTRPKATRQLWKTEGTNCPLGKATRLKATRRLGKTERTICPLGRVATPQRKPLPRRPVSVTRRPLPVRPTPTLPTDRLNPKPHISSTLRPHFVHICAPEASQKRPKAPFCVNFPATRVLKTQRKQGIFSADYEKLRRRVRARRVTRAVWGISNNVRCIIFATLETLG
jgi:hypothetical protein